MYIGIGKDIEIHTIYVHPLGRKEGDHETFNTHISPRRVSFTSLRKRVRLPISFLRLGFHRETRGKRTFPRDGPTKKCAFENSKKVPANIYPRDRFAKNNLTKLIN